jgi:hypothetical protein
MGARRAARRLVNAVLCGESEVILSMPAKLAAAFHGVFPSLTSDILGAVNWLLPAPGGIGMARAKGSKSDSSLDQSVLTTVTEKAAWDNNEVGVA